MRIHWIHALCVCLLLSVAGKAQTGKGFHVRGEIVNIPPGETVSIELRAVSHPGIMTREMASNDGSFDLHNVEAGTYELNVVSTRGLSLKREMVHLDSFANRVTVQLPKAAAGTAAGAGSISFKRLAFRPSKEARKIYRKAESESERNRPAQSMELLLRAIELEPEWAEAYNNLGVQYYRLRRVPEAYAAMKRAFELDPDSPEIGSNFAVVMIPVGQAREAEALIRRVILRNGETPKGRFVLGMALAAQGERKDEARELLTSVAEQFPGAKAFLSGLR